MGTSTIVESQMVRDLGALKDLTDRAARSLGAAVCLKAVKDYIWLREHHKVSSNGMNLTELYEFFHSDRFLLFSNGRDGKDLWDILEKRYEEGSLTDVATMVKKSQEEREKGIDDAQRDISVVSRHYVSSERKYYKVVSERPQRDSGDA